MINFKKMKVGQKTEIDHGKWEDIRHIYDDIQKFCASPDNKKRMQFQVNLKTPGSKSTNPVTKDLFEIERIR